MANQITFNTLRNTLNESHDMIRPVVIPSLIDLINLAENNNEQYVLQDIHSLILNLHNINMSQTESIQIYMESLNTQNSSTRQFLEGFYQPRIIVDMQALNLQHHEVDPDEAVAPGIVPRF